MPMTVTAGSCYLVCHGQNQSARGVLANQRVEITGGVGNRYARDGQLPSQFVQQCLLDRLRGRCEGLLNCRVPFRRQSSRKRQGRPTVRLLGVQLS